MFSKSAPQDSFEDSSRATFSHELLQWAAKQPPELEPQRIFRNVSFDLDGFDILKEWERTLGYELGQRLTNSQTLRLLLLAIGMPPTLSSA